MPFYDDLNWLVPDEVKRGERPSFIVGAFSQQANRLAGEKSMIVVDGAAIPRHLIEQVPALDRMG